MSNPSNLLNFCGDYDTLLAIANKVKRVVVIDFFATWCGPCKSLSAQIPAIASSFPKLVFLKCDVDENKALAAKYGIQSVPQIKFFKLDNGALIEIASVTGPDVPTIKNYCQQFSN